MTRTIAPDALPLCIVLPGQPYVKKNQQRSGAGGYRYNSPGYSRWHRDALRVMASLGWDIGLEKRRKTLRKLKQDVSHLRGAIDYPVNLRCRFYMRTDGIVDMSNLYEGVQDLLVECGVLHDDNWHIVAGHDGSRCAKDRDNPRIEITIEPIPTRAEINRAAGRDLSRRVFGPGA